MTMDSTRRQCEDGHEKPVLGCHACLRNYVEMTETAIAAAELVAEASQRKGLDLEKARVELTRVEQALRQIASEMRLFDGKCKWEHNVEFKQLADQLEALTRAQEEQK